MSGVAEKKRENMDNHFRIGKTSVKVGAFEIGTIFEFHSDNGAHYVAVVNGNPSIFPEDWNRAMNFFLERVPEACRSSVRFERKPF
jgi:hypothetical protein